MSIRRKQAEHAPGDVTGDWAAGPSRLPPAPHQSAVRGAGARARASLGRRVVVLLLLLLVGFVGVDRLAAADWSGTRTLSPLPAGDLLLRASS